MPWPASAPIILADEPTANLDSQVGTQVLDLFRDLAKREDRALLIVTHDPKVRDVADRVAHIRDGVILNRIDRDETAGVRPLTRSPTGGPFQGACPWHCDI